MKPNYLSTISLKIWNEEDVRKKKNTQGKIKHTREEQKEDEKCKWKHNTESEKNRQIKEYEREENKHS